jgi:CRISPR-associated protein Cas6
LIVDLAFPLHGGPLPADHGFALYGAVSEAGSALHGAVDYGIHPVGGRAVAPRRLALTPRSRLIIRTDHAQVSRFLFLAGRTLRVGEARISIGVPATLPLRPSPVLRSRLVVIKGFLEPDSFLEAAARQLGALGITGEPALVVRPPRARFEGLTPPGDGPVRRTLSIHGREVVGFALRVTALAPAASLRLQGLGLGGRRRFGCGIFVPAGER